MKYPLKLKQVLFKIPFLLLIFFTLNKANSNPANTKEINNSIEADLIATRKDEIYNRNYAINREKKLLNTENKSWR